MKDNTVSIATSTGETIVALAIVFLILGGITVIGISAERQSTLAATREVTEIAGPIKSISDGDLFWIGFCVIVFLFILCTGTAAGGDHYGGF